MKKNCNVPLAFMSVVGLVLTGACASTAVPGSSSATPATIAPATDTEVTFQSDGYELHGTWSDVPGARVAAVLLQGSGTTDRDETFSAARSTNGKEAKDFKQVAETLARAGVSSLRFDKRGVREAKGTPPSLDVWKKISRDLLLQDARSAIAWVRSRGFERVMIVGHSEGTSLAMQLAAQAPTASQIHSIVLIGTVGESMKDIAHFQFIDSQLNQAFSIDKNADGFIDPSEVPPELAQGLPIAALDADKDGRLSRPELTAALDGQYQGFLTQVESDNTGALLAGHPALWWRQMFAAGSPLQYVEHISVPVLIMHGERDPQLEFATNAVPLAEAFRRRGADVTFKRYPTYGHGLAPPGDNGALGPIEADALEDLHLWVLNHSR